MGRRLHANKERQSKLKKKKGSLVSWPEGQGKKKAILSLFIFHTNASKGNQLVMYLGRLHFILPPVCKLLGTTIQLNHCCNYVIVLGSTQKSLIFSMGGRKKDPASPFFLKDAVILDQSLVSSLNLVGGDLYYFGVLFLSDCRRLPHSPRKGICQR